MGFFKKVGKFFKKALPVVAPLAAMAIPGVGGLVSGALGGLGRMVGGDQPVELKGDGSLGDSSQSWWSGIGNAVGGLMNQDWVPSAVAGGLSYAGGRETNAAAVEEAQRNRDFQAQQAQAQMDFQSGQAQRSMDFAGSQSAAQMAFQERMANTSMQRGAADAKAAGFNPMLSFMKGGADVPAGSAASGSMGQGASGHGAQANVVNALGGAISSALSVAQAGSQIDLTKAQAREADARALESAVRLPKIEADTRQSVSSAAETDERTKLLKEELNDWWIRRNHAYQKAVQAGTDSKIKAFFYDEVQRSEAEIKKLEAALLGLAVPRARNESEAQGSWWMENVSPYLPDVLKSVGSAGSLRGMMR